MSLILRKEKKGPRTFFPDFLLPTDPCVTWQECYLTALDVSPARMGTMSAAFSADFLAHPAQAQRSERVWTAS